MIEQRNDKNEPTEDSEHREIFSRSVRAGKRTYFFDVKATRRNDYFLTITESKKRFHKDGRFFFEKHKIFLYKEDFEKFTEGLREAITFAGNGTAAHVPAQTDTDEREEAVAGVAATEFSDVDFDELGTR